MRVNPQRHAARFVWTVDITYSRYHPRIHKINKQIGPFGLPPRTRQPHALQMLPLDVGRGQPPVLFQFLPAEEAVFRKAFHYPVKQLGRKPLDRTHKRHLAPVSPHQVISGLVHRTQELDHGHFAYNSKLTADSGHILSLKKSGIKLHISVY